MIGGISANYSASIYGNNYNMGYNNEISNNFSKTGKSSQVEKTECQTCKNRKYVDGSDEANVSFKTPGHISPQTSASKVYSHEQEHVKNAVGEGNKEGNKLISVSVSLETSVCPECGRTYVSGGETRTLMAKSVEDTATNPYNKGEKLVNRFLMQGMNVDLAV